MDQAALTGESLPVKKSKGEKAMMATTVTRGEAEAVVLATGDQTEVGMMNKLIDYFLIWTGERRPCTIGGSRSKTICIKAPGKDEIHFDLEEIMAEMESGERCAWLRDRSFQSELGVSCFRAEQGDCQD